MTSRPLAASRRNPLAVIDPSGYARAAATARRSGVSSPTSLRAGMWRGFLTSVRPFCYFIEGEHSDRATPRPAGVTSVFLKIEGMRIGIVQFKCNTAFLADSAGLLVQTRLNLWDQSVPDRMSTFWSTESQARFKSASCCPETASYSRPVTTRNAESFVPVIFPSDSSRIRPRARQAHRCLA